MRLSEKYGGIQFFAPAEPQAITMVFDSHIKKVTASEETPNITYGGGTWTASGMELVGNYDHELTYTVELDSGYVIDSVSSTSTGSAGFTIAEDGLSFFGVISYGDSAEVTITSKYVAGGGFNNE